MLSLFNLKIQVMFFNGEGLGVKSKSICVALLQEFLYFVSKSTLKWYCTYMTYFQNEIFMKDI